ncbi:MAG: hypothetical protein IIB53_15685 [Planctomycetes bacterium]|nr:hypothetical protein [Planctomycetota bacterium]
MVEKDRVFQSVIDPILKMLGQRHLTWAYDKYVEDATKEYQESQDVVAPFVEARLEFPPGAKVSRAAIWEAYSKWVDTAHERYPLGREALYERLRQRGCIDTKFSEHRVNVRGFSGLGLRAQDVISSGSNTMGQAGAGVTG